MAKRQRIWARKALDRIRVVLHGRCNHCGATESLEMDCIIPKGHQHHAAGISSRACFYRAQLRLGNLQLLCTQCHTKKTSADAERFPY